VHDEGRRCHRRQAGQIERKLAWFVCLLKIQEEEEAAS
jgi:hypothetical protein